MIINSYKKRIASGSIALMLAAGAAWAAPAGDSGSNPSPTQFENIFLGEIETIKYSEAASGPGVVGEVELVRERYADGKIRVERQVTLNNEGNYVNHGAWKLFSTGADVLAEGQYYFGQRTGMWTRWIARNDSPMLNEIPFKQFKAPFMSQAHFADDKMEGDWTIADADDRKMMVVSLKAGDRNGTTTIWLPNGKVFRQMTYDGATPVGDLLEVNAKTGELAKTATFDNGRKIITKTEHYPRGRQLKSETLYLAAKSVVQAPDDFWTTTLAKFASEGKDLRHGSAKTWYPNGQLEQEGTYQNDKKTGTFTYWHENGQVATTGEYRDDQPEGNWVWYHQNGQKLAVGKYQLGTLVGDWRWWDEQGSLTKLRTYSGRELANGSEPASTPAEERVDVSMREVNGPRL